MRPPIGRGGVISLALALALGFAGQAHAATVADLGLLVPSAVNAQDQVVGNIFDSNAQNSLPHAGLWANGVLTPLPEPPNATQSDALGINQAGRIVGDATVPSSGGADVHAEFWDGVGAPTQVGPIASFGPGSDFGQANGVDAAGDVAGFTTAQSTTTPPTFQTTGFWARNGASPPATAGRGDAGPNGFSRVGSMTPSGSLLLGSASTMATGTIYYLWPGASPNAPGIPLDINPTVTGFTLLGSGPAGVMMSSLASDGTVIGYRDSSGPSPVRTYYIRLPTGVETPLSGLAGVNAVNAQHAVVGTILAGGTVHAAIWRNGAVTDLNTLLPAGSGFILSDALAINDNGDIVGVGAHNNQQVGFLLKLGIEAENVEVTQGIQRNSWDTSTTVGVPGYGATSGGAYTGVPLVTDVPTVVRVYASAPASQPQPPQGFTAELHAYTGPSGALSELPGSPISASARTLTPGPALPQARLNPAGAYTFTLPAAWTQSGPLTLVADVNPAATGPAPCAGCTNVFSLTGIGFQKTGPVTIRPFRITYRYPNASGHGFTTVQGADLSSEYQRARELLPLAPGDLIVQPYPQAVLDISAQVAHVVRFWRTRNHIALAKPDLRDCVLIPLCRDDIEAVEYSAIHLSLMLPHTGHTYLAGFEPGIDGATWTSQGVTVIGGASQPPRPLTSTAHELLHLIGFQHAGQNCPGTHVGQGQQGVAWPPDDQGFIQGVGLDRRPNSGGAGLYKIIAPGVGPAQWYDLMSYCASFDANAWLSTINWSKFLTLDPAPPGPAADRAPGASAAAAGRITVDAALIPGGTPMLLGAVATTSPSSRSVSSPYHIKALGSGGRIIANVGVRPEHIDDSTLTMFTATLRAPAATMLELTQGSRVLIKLRRPKVTPKVSLLIPRGGLKAAHHRLALHWRARGTRGVTLTATILYLASAKLGYQTLAAGITTGSYGVPLAMFAHARRVHVRILISDGFSTATATSGVVRLPRG